MNKNDVIAFFDRCAASWDADMIKSDAIIGKILDNTQVYAGMDVLDVACGTGVMFDYYLQRDVASVTGIDISPEMAKIATEKFAKEDKVQVICGDVEEYVFDRKFDRIVVYNAFPHFPEPKRLIRILSGLLKDGGRLTVAHGMSRAAIDGHHSGSASKVSNGLMPALQLAKLFETQVQVEVVITDDKMYQVSGVKLGENVHLHDGIAHTHDAGAETEEMLALMKFMAEHNDVHAQELAELADRVRQMGLERSARRLMDCVTDFDMVNANLTALLRELEGELF